MTKLAKRDAELKLAVEVWRAAAEELAAVKEREARLRVALIVDVFGAGRLQNAGTSTLALASGGSLKLEIRRSAKVDADKLASSLTRLRKLVGAVKAKLIGERLIVWKPFASIRELVTLPPEQLLLFLGDSVTIELSSPSLTFIPAKAA